MADKEGLETPGRGDHPAACLERRQVLPWRVACITGKRFDGVEIVLRLDYTERL